MNIQTDRFLEITESLIYRKKSRIIGINGVDTAGKTIFADHFSQYLSGIGIKNVVLHLDDFHNSSAVRRQGHDEIEAYYYNAFDYNKIIDEVFEPLKKDGYLEKTIYCLNMATDSYDKKIDLFIDKETIILVEGVLLYRTPIIDYIQGKIFLTIDFDEVLKRAKIRDVPLYGEGFLEKYKTKYILIQKRYLSEWKPIEQSDIVIDNQDFLKPEIVSIKD